MRFCVLGSVEVAAEGRRVALGSQRQRTILGVLLAAGGEVVSTHRLIDGLWRARPPASAHKSLQSHLSRLRRTLASVEGGRGDVLLTAVDGYRVDLTACELDSAHFEGLVAQAQGALPSDPNTAVELLDEAHGLWRGAAFGELADHEHVRAEARRLEQLREAGAADRVEARLALGRHEEVLGELEGHPPLLVRPPGLPAPPIPNVLEIREVSDRRTLADFKRVTVEGFPFDEHQPFDPDDWLDERVLEMPGHPGHRRRPALRAQAPAPRRRLGDARHR